MEGRWNKIWSINLRPVRGSLGWCSDTETEVHQVTPELKIRGLPQGISLHVGRMSVARKSEALETTATVCV